jgi:hypothetical protein
MQKIKAIPIGRKRWWDIGSRRCILAMRIKTVGERRGQRIYNTLYCGSLDKNCLRTIYGEQGATIRDYWGDLTEVNFGCGRYVVALSPLGVFSERDLIIRAEDLQLKFKEEADDSTNVPNTKDV